MIALVLATSLLAPPSQTLKDVKKGAWEIRADLPTIRGSRVQTFAGKDVGQRMRKDYDNFLTNARTDRKELPHLPEFSYESGADVKLSNSKFVSVVVGCYRYAGGAHGMGTLECLNYGLVGNKPKRLAWNDVFEPSHRKDFELLLLGLALKEEGADWIQDGMKNSFTDAELSNFWVEKGKGLTWEFDAYALGSYASGPFSFSVPWKTVAPWLRKNGPMTGVR